ncbi:site-specific DNA-methyltransferase [Sphingosinicella sp. BN140058]|uniref:site-specific DNA-methyltransferase n=1 Tax=Sphingosinicella sp. BN140058 TaxID=1892855 RepID=UPI0013ECC46D|nr:site-specific DNA-methyltransferase [Sphingosinicella sp. BN140058]
MHSTNSRKGNWRAPAKSPAAAQQRARRVADGERQREEERRAWMGLPITRSEIILPILQIIQDKGKAAPKDLYDDIIQLFGLDPAIRDEVVTYNGRPSRLWDRSVRWAIQDAKRQGWLFSEMREDWRLTEAGNDALGRVKPGVQIVIFRTELGQAVAAIAREASAIIEPGSVQTLFTSPLFPMCSKLKTYGTCEPGAWLPWMVELMEHWLPLMKDDGTMAIHLGSAIYYRGVPAISSYRERFVIAAQDELGLHRMPDLYWEQPSRLPNLEWGAVRGMHPRPTVDPIYIFSPSPTPYMAAGDMRQDRAEPLRQSDLSRGTEKRPSGLDFGSTSFTGAKTRFPSALITAGNASGAEAWRKRLKTEGLPAHPCPMPIPVPKTAIQMLTRPGDLVFDPFFGSGTTGAAAEELGRRWVGLDHHQVLLDGAALRPQFEHAPGYSRLARAA